MAKIEQVYHVSYQSNEYMGDRWFLHKQQAQNWLNERQDEGCLDIENDYTHIAETKIPKNANSEWWIDYINDCYITR